ncbi:MAG: hypothetical protein GXP53_05490 [Deltaproteobacteria bacterium]|nr:hypothetical protein [Deltaproteobacteria bacterium]
MKNDKKLFTIIGFLLIIGFAVTSLASYLVSIKSLRSEITLNELPLTSDNIYSEIQRDLLRPIFISSLMATDTFLRDWVISGEKDTVKITKYLNEIKKKYNTFTSFFVSENTRNYYYVNGILKKVSPDEKLDNWYFRVRKMKDDYEINVDPDMTNKNEMTIFVNYRVYDYDGRYIGATGVGLKVRAVKRLIEAYQKKYGRQIYFVDKNGAIKLAGSEFQQSITNIFQGKRHEYYKNKILSDTEKSFRYRNGFDIIHVNTRYISEFGWYLVVEQAEGETTRQIFITLMVNLGIFVSITIIILMLVYFNVKAYRNRIETLRGIVPICSFCKQIRDDKGYWNQVDAYVAKYTDAKFSHGVCPDCMKKHYPGMGDATNDEE